MSIQDIHIDEVRIRDPELAHQIPNMVQFGEDTETGVGVFAQLGTGDDREPVFRLPSAGEMVTHLLARSGIKKPPEDVGVVSSDDPVIAFTGGPFRARIPFASDVEAGNKLTVNSDGYAVRWLGDSGDKDAHIIGDALETVHGVNVNNDGELIPVWGEAFINLPSTIIAMHRGSETTSG